jgi:hypothetical protein
LALICVRANSRPQEEAMQDRRQDRATAETITEALRMKTACGLGAAHTLAARRGIAPPVAERALSGRHDPRQQLS